MLLASGVPIVEIMDSATPPLQQAVGFNNTLASQSMTEMMISRGKKHIVYFAARMDERTKQKLAGYEQAMLAAGLTPKVMQTPTPSSYSVGCDFMREVVASYPQVDGVFCTNDDLAIGALFECQRMGIAIPEQIAIAGFHGHNISQVVSPKIATVITPRTEMGKIAAEQLLARIANPEELLAHPVIDLETTLYLGESI
jgi:LacI family gluconate utilization system Gnt-I transcriptional repressor